MAESAEITITSTNVGREGPTNSKVVIFTVDYPASEATGYMYVGALGYYDRVEVIPAAVDNGAKQFFEITSSRVVSDLNGKIYVGTTDGGNSEAGGAALEIRIKPVRV